jgi:hypothetical protein
MLATILWGIFGMLCESAPETLDCRLSEAFDKARKDWVEEQICTLPSLATLYVRPREAGDLQLELHHPTSATPIHLETKCADLSSTISKWTTPDTSLVPSSDRFDFNDKTNIVYLFHESDCEKYISDELDQHLRLMHQEGRQGSKILCLKTKLGERPSQFHREILEIISKPSHLVIVGKKIPPFEYAHASGMRAPFAEFHYGMTDLPYGSINSESWDQSLHKSTAWGERALSSWNGMIAKHHPSEWVLDFDQWVETQSKGLSYRQVHSVSRWPGEGVEEFKRWLEARARWKPPLRWRGLLAEGGSGVLRSNKPHDRRENWKEHPSFSSFTFLYQSDLQALVRQLPKHLEFLQLAEHGHPQGVGELSVTQLSKLSRLATFINLESCYGGAWGYGNPNETSMIEQIFKLPNPPLSVIASQGIKGLATSGDGGMWLAQSFLGATASPQSLGHRQVQAVSLNLEKWQKTLSRQKQFGLHRAWLAHQIFLVHSLFGDPSLEF